MQCYNSQRLPTVSSRTIASTSWPRASSDFGHGKRQWSRVRADTGRAPPLGECRSRRRPICYRENSRPGSLGSVFFRRNWNALFPFMVTTPFIVWPSTRLKTRLSPCRL